MNISWNDLNNVQEPGDYPFRDGAINVTFSEIAIWKKNPNAQFRLMRVHPIRNAFKYVLGQQIGETLAAPDSKLIYESNNGDSWWLGRDPVTGGQAVLHRPNPQSGGQVSSIEVGKFLAPGADGPEHQALKRLLEASPGMATILIGYDIHLPKGEVADKLTNAIKSLGSWWHHLETIWIVQCLHRPSQIRDRLQPYIGVEDQLLVVDISGDETDWFGVNESGTEWLRANI
jgi:hypothetical protein